MCIELRRSIIHQHYVQLSINTSEPLSTVNKFVVYMSKIGCKGPVMFLYFTPVILAAQPTKYHRAQ